MPRRVQDGEAAQAGADLSVIQDKLRRQKNRARRAEMARQFACEIDGAYFRANPDALAYERPLLFGEEGWEHPCGWPPDRVIVAQAEPGAWIFGGVWPGRDSTAVMVEAITRATEFRRELVAQREERARVRAAAAQAIPQRGQA